VGEAEDFGCCGSVSQCPGAGGDCCIANGTPGCDDVECCESVCAIDPFCCDISWDSICAGEAQSLCDCGGGTCPPPGPSCPGCIIKSDPADGTVDARLPHDLNDASILFGIDTVVITTGVAGASDDCWSLCETGTGIYAPNSIASITDNGDGSYTIVLSRGTTPYEVTSIIYAGEDCDDDDVDLIGHPGNVNADTFTSAVDIIDLIDILNLVDVPIYGLFSCDIDLSNLCAPPDIIREIDIINGASALDVGNFTPLPTDDDCE
jgi:hypothetical protein